MPLSDDALVELLHETALEIRGALDGLDDWGPAGTVPGQYLSDLAADAAGVRCSRRRAWACCPRSRACGTPTARSSWCSIRSTAAPTRPAASRGSRRACAPSTPTGRGPRWSSTCPTGARSPRCGAAAPRSTGCRSRRRGAPTPATLSSGSRACRRAPSAGASSGRWAPPPSTCARWRRARSTGSSTAARPPTGLWDYLGGALVCREAGAVVADALGRDLVVLDHGARRTPVGAATPELLDGPAGRPTPPRRRTRRRTVTNPSRACHGRWVP